MKSLAAAVMMAVLAAAPAGAPGAERDICENKSGPELVRCIEAAARGGQPAEPSRSVPAPESSRPALPPQAPGANIEPPRAPAEDCSGRSGDALRRCLASGGRLGADTVARPAPAAAAVPAQAASGAGCEGKSGEALRACVEAAARAAPPASKRQAGTLNCTRYTAADQPLCLQRNAAIIECRNRARYPDAEVCLRSRMADVPQPGRAECGKLAGQARAHCESRNQVYAGCAADKMGYFACLEQRLGADAVLSRRP